MKLKFQALCAAMAFVVVFMVAGPARASITYVMKAYPQYQVSRSALTFNFAGTITTDGTIGALSSANILSWQFTSTAVDNSKSYSFSSADEPVRKALVQGTVLATPSQIQIPRFTTLTGGVFNLLSLPVTLPAPENISMSFEWYTGGATTSALLTEHFGFQATRAAPLADPWSGVGLAVPLSLPDTTGPIIVAIPEPSTLCLLALPVVGLLRRRTKQG